MARGFFRCFRDSRRQASKVSPLFYYGDVLACAAVLARSEATSAQIAEVRPDGTRVTVFRDSLAEFAGIAEGVEPATAEWNEAVSSALAQARSDGLPADPLYGTDAETLRLSARLTEEEVNSLAELTGISLEL